MDTRMNARLSLAALAGLAALSTGEAAPPLHGGVKRSRRHSDCSIPAEERRADGAKQQYKSSPKVGRNDSCPCGSGTKYKKCCGKPAIPVERVPEVYIPPERVGRSKEPVVVQSGENRQQLAKQLLAAGAPPERVWAFMATGRYYTEGTQHLYSAEEQAEWNAAVAAYAEATPEQRATVLPELPVDVRKSSVVLLQATPDGPTAD